MQSKGSQDKGKASPVWVMPCLARAVSPLYKRIKRLFSIGEKDTGQDKPRQGHGKPRQAKAEQDKPRARQALPVSCPALLGESLLYTETIRRLLSFRENERGQGRVGAWGKASQCRARQAKARTRQALPVSCLALPGESLSSL